MGSDAARQTIVTDYFARTGNGHRRQRRRAILLCVALVVASSAALACFGYAFEPLVPSFLLTAERFLGDENCTIQPYTEIRRESDIEPTAAASFPGSGAAMTWMLVKALTGQDIGDDWDFNGLGGKVVTVKTHFPHSRGNWNAWGTKEDVWPNRVGVPRAILLIRNPAKAIPSYHSFLYEAANKLGGHSVRAPNEEWIKFRDGEKGCKKECTDVDLRKQSCCVIGMWVRQVKWWMDNYSGEENRLIIAYEDLVSEEKGSATTRELAAFLKKSKGVEMVPDEHIECTWRRVVKGGGKKHPESLRKGDSQLRLYPREQLDMMLEAIKRLREEYEEEENLVAILDGYYANIAAMPVDDDSNSSVKASQ